MKQRMKAVGVIVALALMLTAAGCGRRTVVNEAGEPVDTPRTRVALALSDFGTAFVAYGDLVVELRDAGAIDADRANSLIARNIAVVDAADVAVGVIQNSGGDADLLDALETTATAIGDLAELESVGDGRLQAAFLAARNYLVLAISIARANF